MSEVTHILQAVAEGDAHSAEQLLPLVYDELRKLAAQKLAQNKPGQTLQATALVHEAYVRLVPKEAAAGPGRQHWDNRGHFFGAAAEKGCRLASGDTGSFPDSGRCTPLAGQSPNRRGQSLLRRFQP